MKRGLCTRLAGAMLLAIAVAGCGGDAAEDTPPGGAQIPPTPTISAAPPDACSLATDAEVRGTAGIEGSGTRSTSGGADVCTWTDRTGKSAIVQVYPAVERYEQSRQAFETLYRGTAENLTAIGDAAFYIGGATSSIPTATISARRGGSAVSVQVMGMNQDAAALREQALALTRIVLSRL